MSALRRILALSVVLATGGASSASAAQPAPAPPPPTPTEQVAPTPTSDGPAPGRAMAITGTVLIMVSAGGYVAMAVGLGMGANADADLRALGSVDEIEKRRDVMDRGQLGNRLAIGAGIASAAVLATGIALVVLGRRKADESRKTVSWLPLPAGAGLQLGGRF